MAIRKLKPTSPGQRHKIIGSFENITASEPEKSLVVGKTATGGRNSRGKMTTKMLVAVIKDVLDISTSRERKMVSRPL